MPNEIPVRVIGEDANGEPIVGRVMTAEEIKERLDLNIANTAEQQRRWVLTEQAKSDGRG